LKGFDEELEFIMLLVRGFCCDTFTELLEFTTLLAGGLC
jgi:hypothetical protein